MTKWEYLRIQEPTDQQLAQIGADGWELVSTTAEYKSLKQRWSNGNFFQNVYVFKREVQEGTPHTS